MTTPVEIEARDGVATVTVANPPVNALSDPVLEALADAATVVGSDDDIRAVVLTGAGDRSFVAGADLRAFTHALGDEAAMREHVALTGRVFAAFTLGLIPGAGGTQRLPRRVGPGPATRMLLLGELLDAEQARAAGLVDHVSAPGDALHDAQALAGRLAALPGRAVRAAKAALGAARTLPLPRGLDAERKLFLGVAATADAQEGAAAFLAKRAPDFIHA